MKLSYLVFLLVCFFLISCGESKKKKEVKSVTKIELTNENLEKGAQLYRAKCMNCHMKNGQGVEKFYPPLASSDYLEKHLTDAIYMVKYGSNKPIKVNGVKYNSLMPSSGLTDTELVLVFNYVLNSWGNQLGTVSLEQVKSVQR